MTWSDEIGVFTVVNKNSPRVASISSWFHICVPRMSAFSTDVRGESGWCRLIQTKHIHLEKSNERETNVMSNSRCFRPQWKKILDMFGGTRKP